ncbi:PE-PGRS family protein [Umezawaea sp. Da 62-37]|uniref:PE-PGRS family protein n=1 Tax=Umezawaea sp. Da 62-37 TaxID=3075927 RepID=UPI0028F7060F|nr:PE-PGRS family protein [Umezawaea sp. Da 62-37]WNV86912.1 PE-PGRS family protein [Umezawaea sp. Da 62-37]
MTETREPVVLPGDGIDDHGFPSSPDVEVSIGFETAEKTITVPAGTAFALVRVVGAQGGYGNDNSGAPGRGGTVQARIAVTAGESLTAVVGEHPGGRGGSGFNSGGNGGAGRSALGRDGGAGGGSSALCRGGTPLLVAGGGGGAGGGAPTADGGRGGSGAASPGSGTEGHGPNGGDGGVGGGAGGTRGGRGGDAADDGFTTAGGGGGGGGGYNGGSDPETGGGAGGHAGETAGAGGGGGAGASYIRQGATETAFGTFSKTGNGKVDILKWIPAG